ncbi:hypothetical protein F4779DRAFT_616074 [Xylariaceae sp. FL0662B]|nr:hypothetical protein F4779DRAFT_616074 [Xylariaceae sp. FL0662B]
MPPINGEKAQDDERKAEKEKNNARYSKWWVTGASLVALSCHYFFGPSIVFKPASPSLQACLNNVCAGRDDCVRYSGDGDFSYYTQWIRPWNLAWDIVPAAVVRPQNTQEVSAVVKCCAQHDVKVQARSGGHSYANYGLGGENGAVSIDLEYFQYLKMNDSEASWKARVGAGTRLGEVDKALHPYGRAFSHGVCPGVGIGGHATIGGLGPMSRMWGASLDHIDELEVVTADGGIVRANTGENADLFFALRGAGAGFGIITEFVMKTHPVPKDVIHYSYNFQFSRLTQMVDVFEAWQNLVADPTLDPRLGTEFTLYPLGASVTATFYGSEEELKATGLLDRLPHGKDPVALRHETWDGSMRSHAVKEALYAADIPNRFFSKSLGFTRKDMISKANITELFKWVDEQPKGTYLWSIIFDATGGAVSKVPTDATAYAHRDKFMFYQSYGINILNDNSKTKRFLEQFHEMLLGTTSGGPHSTYPGYVDPYLENPQQAYWMSNLPALEAIKAKWDPTDLFHNPQSVLPKKF